MCDGTFRLANVKHPENFGGEKKLYGKCLICGQDVAAIVVKRGNGGIPRLVRVSWHEVGTVLPSP
jgi:hypothetical protein